MTTRNPLVRISGKIVELPSGDVLGGGAQGPVGMTWQGAWSSATSYVADDVVSDGGSSWIAVAGNTNQEPPNATYWNELAAKGDTGATGPTGPTGPTGAPGSNGTNGAMSLIQQIVTSSSQSTVDFTSIAGTYNVLKVFYFSRDTATGTGNSILRLKVNNDGTAANYTSSFRIGSDNATAFASSVAASTAGVYMNGQPNDGNTNGIFCSGEITIVGYASTVQHKRILAIAGQEDGAPDTAIQLLHARWISTAAITRLTFSGGTAFKDGSTFMLYGL